MHLTESQTEIIRESFQLLQPEVDRVTTLFYEDLFNRVPRLRELFGDDLAAQGMRFMSAIGFILDNLDDEEELNRRLDLLAEGHAQFKLQPAAYREMEEALIDTFAHALKAKFTNEIEIAWRAAFRQICDRMIEKTDTTS